MLSAKHGQGNGISLDLGRNPEHYSTWRKELLNCYESANTIGTWVAMLAQGENSIGNKIDGIGEVAIGQPFKIEEMDSYQLFWVGSEPEALLEGRIRFKKPGILYIKKATGDTDSNGMKQYHRAVILCGIKAQYPEELIMELAATQVSNAPPSPVLVTA